MIFRRRSRIAGFANPCSACHIGGKKPVRRRAPVCSASASASTNVAVGRPLRLRTSTTQRPARSRRSISDGLRRCSSRSSAIRRLNSALAYTSRRSTKRSTAWSYSAGFFVATSAAIRRQTLSPSARRAARRRSRAASDARFRSTAAASRRIRRRLAGRPGGSLRRTAAPSRFAVRPPWTCLPGAESRAADVGRRRAAA